MLLDSDIAIAKVRRAELELKVARMKLWLLVIFRQFRRYSAGFKFITKFLLYIVYSGILLTQVIGATLDPAVNSLGIPFFVLSTLGFVVLTEWIEDFIEKRIKKFFARKLDMKFFSEVPTYKQELMKRHP